MRRLLFLFLLFVSSNGFSEECKSPDVKAGLGRIFKDLLVSDITIITYKSFSPRIQWVGLYWEAPVSGALIAYDCGGKFLSGVRTGGIQTLKFFPGPRSLQTAVAVEEIYTGTGYDHVGYSIFTIQNNKIRKVREHTRHESISVIPSEDAYVDDFEIIPSGPAPDDFGTRLRVEGVRKVYPVQNSPSSDFRLEKLATEHFCWNKTSITYEQCK
jgi:hypothetical protein